MTVKLDGDHIRLEGECRVEEAESLAALLHADRERPVDVGACRALHSAVLQVLVAYGADIRGAPEDIFLREAVLPAIRERQSVHSLGQRLG